MKHPTTTRQLPAEPQVCVLIALDLLLDRETTSQAMTLLRPHWSVQKIDPKEIDGLITACHPKVVLCSTLTDTIVDQVPMWFLADPAGSSRYVMSLGGARTNLDNLSFYRILEMIDQTYG